jgi:hypothetical protein
VKSYENHAHFTKPLPLNVAVPHNQTVLQEAQTGKAGVRIIACWLPTKSPWLNRTLAEMGPWQASHCRACSVVDRE